MRRHVYHEHHNEEEHRVHATRLQKQRGTTAGMQLSCPQQEALSSVHNQGVGIQLGNVVVLADEPPANYVGQPQCCGATSHRPDLRPLVFFGERTCVGCGRRVRAMVQSSAAPPRPGWDIPPSLGLTVFFLSLLYDRVGGGGVGAGRVACAARVH